MPYQSQAQMRKFFALEDEGKLPKGTAKKWAHETPDVKSLPEHKGEKPKRYSDMRKG